MLHLILPILVCAQGLVPMYSDYAVGEPQTSTVVVACVLPQ